MSLILLLNIYQFLRLYQFYHIVTFIASNLEKDCHQSNVSFVCLQIYKHGCLLILACNICFDTKVKNQ